MNKKTYFCKRIKRIDNNLMKKTTLAAMAVMLTLSAGAATAKKDSVNPNKPVFTVIKQNPIIQSLIEAIIASAVAGLLPSCNVKSK